MRNLISEIVKKCTLPVHRNRTLRLELFVPPTSLNVSVVARFSIFAFFVRMAIFQIRAAPLDISFEFWPTLWRFFTWFAISALLAFRDISARSPYERKPFCLWRAKVVPLLPSADKGDQAVGGGGFPQPIMSMISGYSSNRKQKEIEPKELLSCSVPRLLTNPQLEILVKALILIPRGARSVLLHPRGSNPCPHTLQVSGLPAELVLTW